MVPDVEEMVVLIPEFITADILTSHQKYAIATFAEAVAQTEMFGREDTQQVVNRAIQGIVRCDGAQSKPLFFL